MTTPYVLLADDDRAIRLVAQKALEKAGFRVHSVDRISSLMEVIVNPEFQVLVTDVAFPDGDALVPSELHQGTSVEWLTEFPH